MVEGMGSSPAVLWQPSDDAWETSRIGQFLRGVERRREISFADYEEAWRWSIENLADLCGTTLETAIRTMSRLARERIVTTAAWGFVITNRPELERLARGEPRGPADAPAPRRP